MYAEIDRLSVRVLVSSFENDAVLKFVHFLYRHVLPKNLRKSPCPHLGRSHVFRYVSARAVDFSSLLIDRARCQLLLLAGDLSTGRLAAWCYSCRESKAARSDDGEGYY